MKKATPAQLRQRELSWALFVAEGSAANILHTARVNCVTFTDSDQRALCLAYESATRAAEYLRNQLSKMKGA